MQSLKLKIQAHIKVHTVQLKQGYSPATSIDDAVIFYQGRTLLYMERVDKLINLLEFADLAKEHIQWSRYRWLMALRQCNAHSLDFVDEALRYGMCVSLAYRIHGTETTIDEEIYRKVYMHTERQQASLSTRSHDVRVHIPDEWNRWVGPLLEESDVLHKDPRRTET